MNTMLRALVVATCSAALANAVDVDKRLSLGPATLPANSFLGGDASVSVQFDAAVLFKLDSDTCFLTASMDTGTVSLTFKREASTLIPAIDQTGEIKLVPGDFSVVNPVNSTFLVLRLHAEILYFGLITGRVIFKKKAGQHRCCFKEWDAYVQIEASIALVADLGSNDEYKLSSFALDQESLQDKICPAQPEALSTVNAQSPTGLAMMFLSGIAIAMFL